MKSCTGIEVPTDVEYLFSEYLINGTESAVVNQFIHASLMNNSYAVIIFSIILAAAVTIVYKLDFAARTFTTLRLLSGDRTKYPPLSELEVGVLIGCCFATAIGTIILAALIADVVTVWLFPMDFIITQCGL